MPPQSPNLRQMRRVDVKRRLKRVFATVRLVCWVGLLAYDAPERIAACSALLPVVLSCYVCV